MYMAFENSNWTKLMKRIKAIFVNNLSALVRDSNFSRTILLHPVPFTDY